MQLLTTRALAHRPPVLFPDAERILIAYSGGKDSLCCMDLAVQLYGAERVQGFYLYFVKGMDLTQAIVRYAWERWRVSIRIYPHWFTSEYLRRGQFCDPRPDVPILKMADVERVARADAGCRYVVYGYRQQDSLERNAMLKHDFPRGIAEKWGRVAPLYNWSTKDVRLYLKQQGIALPAEQELKQRSSNVGLFTASMWWLRQYWPADYERVLRVFPYARLQADRHDEIMKEQQERRRVRELEKAEKKKTKGTGRSRKQIEPEEIEEHHADRQ